MCHGVIQKITLAQFFSETRCIDIYAKMHMDFTRIIPLDCDSFPVLVR